MRPPIVESRRRQVMKRPRTIAPWSVLAGALLLTLLLAWATAAAARVRDRVRFERAAATAQQRVEARLGIYIALLRGSAGLLAVNPALTRNEFAAYIGRLDVRGNYPGAQGVGVTLRVDSGDVVALESRMRAQGLPDFRITPDSARGEYHAITHLEPLDLRNRAALGYDMYTEPVRREAMQRAQSTADVAMSGRVTLVQEITGPRQAGFLIYVPVYSGNRAPATDAARHDSLVAFAYSPFRADDFFAGIFGSRHDPEVAMRIYDGNSPAPGNLLHDSATDTIPVTSRFAEMADTLRVDAAGRPWTMVVTPASAFADGRRTALAPIVALLGVVVSVALFALASARRHAVTAVADARDLFGRVLEQAPVAICVLRGPGHVFEVANPSYRRLLADDPIGRPVRDVIPGAEPQGFIATLDAVYRSGIPWVGNGVELAYDSARAGSAEPEYFNVLYFPFMRRDGSTDGVIAVAVDVTPEVTARRDAEAARQEAEHANRAKSDFLAAMSHELRTPLNAIGGYVQLVQLGVYGPVTATQNEALTRVQRSGGHLLSLINDVLHFAKLEAGRVEFDIRDIELRGVIGDVIHMIEPLLEAKQLTCRVDVPSGTHVRVDEEKLRQILLNLLSNAAKFTEEGGISVHTSAPAGAGAHVVYLHVTDTGIGIPAERHGAVFDPFVQVNRGFAHPAEGTGLGLAISRDLAHGMGADIAVKSIVGRGSTFTLTLPAAAT